MGLRALVVGAGWAGEGHALALRDAGVGVVALCGRTPEFAYARARQLEIPAVRFDVRSAIAELHPDIVVIATPGDTHRAIAEAAAVRKCWRRARPTRAMLDAVERAGVKHGYATTIGYPRRRSTPLP